MQRDRLCILLVFSLLLPAHLHALTSLTRRSDLPAEICVALTDTSQELCRMSASLLALLADQQGLHKKFPYKSYNVQKDFMVYCREVIYILLYYYTKLSNPRLDASQVKKVLKKALAYRQDALDTFSGLYGLAMAP